MAKKKIWHATAQVISVWDGDTFKARIDLLSEREIPPAQRVDLGFRLFLESAYTADVIASAAVAGVHLYTEINVRLFGFGAPELDEPRGEEAKQFLENLLPIGATVRLESRRLDKYGRCEAVVTMSDGGDVGETMFARGLVRHANASGYKPTTTP
jgi:endonuclease YncB( thermonuclease family)